MFISRDMAHVTRSSVIVIFGFFALFLTIGFGTSSGVLYNDWINYFEDDSKEAVASATALNAGLYLGCGPLAAVICQQLGFRFGLLLGGACTSVGALGAAFSQNALHLALSFGVSMGMGEAMILVPVVALVALHNPERTRRANSIGLLDVAAGMAVFPIVYEAVSDVYAWQGTLLIYSAVLLNLLAVAALNVEPPRTEAKLQVTSSDADSRITKANRTAGMWHKLLYLLRYPEMHLHVIAEICWNFSNSIVFILAPQYANVAANTNVPFLVSFIGYGTLTGRLFVINTNLLITLLTSACDYIPFFRKVPSWLLFSLSIGLGAVPIGIYPFGKSTTFFVGCVFAAGMFYGIAVCCQAPTYAELVDTDLLVVMVGLMYFFDGLGYLMGSPVVIAITKATGKAEHMFYISAASFRFGGLALVNVALVRKWRNKRALRRKRMSPAGDRLLEASTEAL